MLQSPHTITWRRELATLKRCALGIVLILLASSVLLFSDWNQRSTRGSMRRIAILQHVSQPLLDEGVAGILDGLAAAGFKDGENVVIDRYNAENDIATANAIAKQIASSVYDLVVTSSTFLFSQWPTPTRPALSSTSSASSPTRPARGSASAGPTR